MSRIEERGVVLAHTRTHAKRWVLLVDLGDGQRGLARWDGPTAVPVGQTVSLSHQEGLLHAGPLGSA